MRILLDTHVFIWLLQEDEKRLGRKFIREIADNSGDNYISKVSLWEIATKIRLGKLGLKENFIEKTRDTDLQILDIELEHIERYQTLPLHHRDPFDRMIIAQAIVENMRIATSDDDFEKYSVKLLKQ